MYRRLSPDSVLSTAELLARRIAERFPDRGLARVAQETVEVTREAAELADWLARPIPWARTTAWLVTGICAFALIAAVAQLDVSMRVESAAELAQGVESLINNVVFAGIAVWFVFGIERRIKRKRAWSFLMQLRSLAHVIDMHQLNKDPGRASNAIGATPSSPTIDLDGPLLAKYLDYSSELLSVLGKLAALTSLDFDDPVTLATVDEIEDLSTGLSRKIWQKIMIIDRVTPR